MTHGFNVAGKLWAAAGGVVAGTGVAAVQRGCAMARTGAGVYTCTLDKEVDATDSVCFAMPMQATPCQFSYQHTSDGVKTIRTFDAATGATPTDATFDFFVFKLS
jgi:hypothetical protein